MSKGAAKGPERTCLGCRAKKPQPELVRLALDGCRVVFDRDRSLGGRGAWLCPDSAECLNLAWKKNVWGRCFRAAGPFDLSALEKLPAEAADQEKIINRSS